ncbi:MAG: hypothetical protein Kow0090_01260 [Myxococcota bacterium]
MIKLFADDPGRFNSFRLSSLSPFSGELLALLIAAVFIALLLSYLALRGLSAFRKKAMLFALRLLALVFIALAVIEPAITLEERAPLKGKIALLIDNSKSLTALSSEAETRFDKVKKWLSTQEGELVKLSRRFDIEAGVFSEDVANMPLAGLYSELGKLTATGERSEIIGAIKEAVGEDIEGRLSGIILLTDGIDTQFGAKGMPEEAVLEKLSEKGIPVFAVDTASGGELRDIAVSSVRADDFVYIRNTTEVDVEVVSYNYSGNATVNLYSEQRIISSEVVNLSPGGSAQAKLKFIPQRVGNFAYTVKVEPLAGELSTENNALSFIQKVIRDKIRLLHITGNASWDVRFLRSYLRSRPDIDLVSFYILRTIEDTIFIPNDQLSLIPFPTDELFQEQLYTFDILIFHNFDYAPYNIGTYLDNIKRFVEKDGGGFIIIGGDRGLCKGGYRGTPIEDILPVEFGVECEVLDEPFTPKTSRGAEEHPLSLWLKPTYSRRSSDGATLANLPGFSGADKSLVKKRDGQVLLEHPFEKSLNGDPLPIIVAGEYGEGRSLVINTDNFWRLYFGDTAKEGQPRLYNSFFDKALRYITKDPETQNIRLSLSSESATKNKESKVRINSLIDGSGEMESKRRLNLELRKLTGDKVETAERLSVDLERDGSGEILLPPLEEGVYRLKVLDKEGSEILFKATTESVETRELIPRPEFLKALAKASGGEYLTVEKAEVSAFKFPARRLSRLLAEEHHPLWNNWLSLALLGFFAGAEWFLRRRAGFL